jgi:two-component system, chemotaxis family, response regulator Rcp1
MADAFTRPFILVIEPNPDHAQQIQAALNENVGRYHIQTMIDGSQALDFLHQRSIYADAPRPDLILLNLNLPDRDGQEILAELKVDPHLKRIPIVVLTTSANPNDILRTYHLQGNCYVIKSDDLPQLLATVKRVEEFWLGIVTLPVG